MATSLLNRTLAKSSESGGEDSSYSTRRSIPRRHRSLSRFSHRTPDPDCDTESPMRKGKFVNTVRGSGFGGEISLDDLAVEFFESFSSESGLSSSERGRSGSRKSTSGGGGDAANSQRRGRSVSRAGSSGNGGLRRLDADTESSRRRRSLSRNPSTAREITGKSGGLDPGRSGSSRRRSVSRQPTRERVNSGESSGGLDPGRSNSSRRRSVSRQPPRERVNSGENAIRGRAIGGDREKENSRRRQRSLSVVRRRIDNSESDRDQVQHSSNSRDVKKSGKSLNGGSSKPAASDHRQGPRRSLSQNPVKYHDGYSSHSSAVTDDEGKESSSIKHGTERIIRTVYAQVTPKKRESLGNSDYGSQRKSHDDHHAISTYKKGYATKLQESEERKRDLLAEIMLEEQRGKELSMNLKELLTENSSVADEKPSRMRKRSKDRSRRLSMCLTDEAEQFIDEFISNIEDTDFSSFEDEKSESSSSFGLIKSQSSQSTTVPKSVPVEMDGVMLPWLQWETPDDTSAALTCFNKSLHTPNAKPFVWEYDPSQDASSGQGTSNGTISRRGSWSPYESATKTVSPIRRLKIDVSEYLKRPNSAGILNESWKLRHRISSGSLVLSSRSLI